MRSLSITTIAVLSMLLLSGCCEPLPPRPTVPEPPVPEPDTDSDIPEPAPPAEVPFVLLPSDSSNSVSFRFVFDTGSADDPDDMRGLTALTALLMAEGGTEDLSYSELTEALFPMAAEISVQVDKEQTTFFGRVHKDQVSKYYPLLRDILTAPRMAQGDFDRLRDKTRTALTMALRGNDDEELGKASLDWLMYADHPYQAPAIGTESGLKAASLEAVSSHRESVFCASRLTVGVSGAYSDDLIEKIKTDLESLPADCEARTPADAPARPEGRKLLLVDKPTAEATAISIGFPVEYVRGEKDYAAMKLVEAYFGQHRTFSGKLQKEIRVLRGFNYGNYAYAEHFDQLGWSRIPKTNVARKQQCFSLWLRPVKDAEKHFVLRLAIAELSTLVDRGITQEELDATRTFMKRYYLTFAQTEEQRLGFALDDAFYGQETPYFESLFAALDKLTVEEVNEAIKRNLTAENLNIAMVTRNADEFEKVLAADTAQSVKYPSEKPAEVLKKDKTIATMKLNLDAESISIIPIDKIFE